MSDVVNIIARLKSITQIRERVPSFFLPLSTETFRPLWVPYLHSILDPNHSGYVHFENFLSWAGERSIKHLLLEIILNSVGFNYVVECQILPGDHALSLEFETPNNAAGWMSMCQISSISLPSDFSILDNNEISEVVQSNFTFEQLKEYNVDPSIGLNLTYMQTGQSEYRNATHVRPLWGIELGAPIAISRGDGVWSLDYKISSYLALPGGSYHVTATRTEKVLRRPLIHVIQTPSLFEINEIDEQFVRNFSAKSLPSLDISAQSPGFLLLGNSNFFWEQPKTGQLVQFNDIVDNEYVWVDAIVTDVDEKQVWLKKKIAMKNNLEQVNDDETEYDSGEEGYFNFEELSANEIITKVWNPTYFGFNKGIRPYRCLDIGDSVECPVSYIDLNSRKHTTDFSQRYLAGRITEILRDKCVVTFSMEVALYAFWNHWKNFEDGMPKKNLPIEQRRIEISLDRVRPLSNRPKSVLRGSSIVSDDIKTFQGTKNFSALSILEKNVWASYDTEILKSTL
ncbi:hypothetical protein HK096_008972 [Nowakowskiella sp. JEL0078]|nr:hypothetical protein HK096_008972 [Nowakowskiella sp. JEL0078]